jgi:ABC-type transport system involved in cytochrome bd biosynthesis fused ATPase/permease subunit
VTSAEAQKNLSEEFTDVLTCAAEFRLYPDLRQAQAKLERFAVRWEKAHRASKS